MMINSNYQQLLKEQLRAISFNIDTNCRDKIISVDSEICG